MKYLTSKYLQLCKNAALSSCKDDDVVKDLKRRVKTLTKQVKKLQINLSQATDSEYQ